MSSDTGIVVLAQAYSPRFVENMVMVAFASLSQPMRSGYLSEHELSCPLKSEVVFRVAGHEGAADISLEEGTVGSSPVICDRDETDDSGVDLAAIPVFR